MTASLHLASFSVRSAARVQTVCAVLLLNYACACGQE
jgi:hypothetical protein